MNNDSNDMDKLMREAAEKYALNTNSADWSKVAQQLHPATELLAGQKKKEDYRYLYLLLLLPLGFICGRYVDNGASDYKQKLNTEQSNHPIKNGQILLNQTSIAGKPSSHTIEKPNSRLEKNNVIVQNNFFNNTAKFSKRKIHFYSKPKLFFSVDTNQRTSSVSEPLRRNNIIQPPGSFYKISNEKNADDEAKNVPLQQKSLINNGSSIIQPHLADSTKSFPVYETQSNIAEAHVVTSDKKAKTKQGKPFFYAGIVLGPDFSLVKSQQITHTGSTTGIIAGLQLSKKWAVETGAWWAMKNYYSAGEYFSTAKIPMPYNAKIITVDGSCNMIELPLNVRYNVLQKTKSGWFLSAGLSSYLMKKEEYTYLYERNNVQYNVSKSYKNSSRDWFSVMNISGGYQHQMGKAVLRIEPYIKLPLKGVGIGKLPITSTGIYLSVTYPLAK